MQTLMPKRLDTLYHHNLRAVILEKKIKDQENPNFRAFGTYGSLTNYPAFNPGKFGKYPDGTEISKF